MNDNTNTTVRVDGYTRFCLTAITVLLTLVVIGLWADHDAFTSQARAEKYKDDAAKRAFSEGRWGTSSAANKLAAAQESTNKRLDELIALFRDGEAKVRIVEGSKGSKSSGGSNVRKKKK